MNTARKIFLWGASVTGVLFVVTTAAALVFLHLFNAGAVGRDFMTGVEARYHVRASKISIAFRPFPVVALHGVTAAIPGTLEASAATVWIHPGLLPLLTGKFTPTKIELLHPVIGVRVSQQQALHAEGAPSQRFAGLIKTILRPLAGLSAQMRQVTILARHGALKISNINGQNLFFQHIDFTSTARHRGVDYQLLIGQSSFWHTLELKGLVDPGSLKGSGVLNVTGGYPQSLARCLSGSPSCRAGGSVADITAALFYSGANFRADFTASVPSFVFGIGPQSMTIRDGFLAGVLTTDAQTIQLTLSDFRFAQPHLNLTASFTEKYSDGSLSLTVDGSHTDVATVRSLLLAVNEKTDGVEHFFEILRQGQVPKISFSTRANKLSDLLKLENMGVKCSLEKGVVLAPEVDLLVSNVSGDISISDGVLTATHIHGQTRGSSTRGGELRLGLPHENPLFHLDLPVEADLSELPAVLGHLAKDDAFKQELAKISGVTGKTRGRLVIGEKLGALGVKVSTGRFRLSLRDARLGQPISLEGASFDMDGNSIRFSQVDTSLADSTLLVTGSFGGFWGRQAAADLQVKGRLGPEASKLAASLAGLPNWLKPISGMDLVSSTITWEKGTKTTFTGKMELSGGPRIEADVVETPGEFSIRRLAIKDRDSDAEMAVSSLKDGFRIGFSGTLGDKTMDALLTPDWPFKGPIAGKFQADIYPASPQKSSGEGDITLSNFRLPSLLPPNEIIEKASIAARGKKLDIKSATATWEGSRLNFTGSVAITDSSYLLDMNASTDSLDLDRLLKSEWMAGKVGGKSGPLRPGFQENIWDKPLAGVVRVKTGRLIYAKMLWAPANADVLINRGAVDIRLTRATICGISTPGKIRVGPEGADIALDISARGKDLQSTLACFFSKKRLVSGSYELSGHIEAKGPGAGGKVPVGSAGLAQSLQGQVALQAKDGRIFRFNAFTKIISVLSVSEIYRGVVPDLINKGCPYKTLQIKGTIKNGSLVLSDSVLDGPSIKMVFSGQIDLVRNKINVIALVAPQRTVERVVNATPVVGKVLKDAFITVPVRISGDLDDPSVVLLSPGAVGHEIFGVMQRLVKFPLTMFQPSGKKTGNP